MNQIRSLPVLFMLGLVSACGGSGSGGSAPTLVSATGNSSQGSVVVTSKLSGKVLDKSGQPITGITVNVFHHNENTTVTTITDANGAYAVSGLSTVRNADYAVYATKAGYGFTPSVADAAGAVGKLDFNGLYRTVIRFLAMPGHDVASANFTALGAGDKVASIARTGQSVSYASGDDFAAKSGVAWPSARFVDNGDGTVSDRLSGLVWLKNAGCFSPTSWAAALTAANQLASGACGLSDGSTAGKWRMPNVNELESLVDVARANPAVSSAHPFANINLSNAYWSSTTYTAATANAMAIRLTDGRWINGVDGSFDNNKTTSINSLWAVKSGGAGTVQLLATGVYDSQGGGSFGTGDDASLQIGAALPSPRFIDKGDGTTDVVQPTGWARRADSGQVVP